MGNIPDQTVICKCLNLIELSDDAFPIFNYRLKFTLVKAVKLFIDAQLNQRTDLDEITNTLRASETLQQAIGLESISSSQVSRTLGKLPLNVLQELFIQVNQRVQKLFKPQQGIPGMGRLRIVDSTVLSLPEIAGKWAYCSKQSNGVKIHTQLVVSDLGTVYPDKIICSTRGVADSEVALELIVDEDAIHVVDRGYIVYRHYKKWLDQNLRFVARIQKNNKTTIVCQREINESSNVLRDADVMVSFNEEGKIVETRLRLVEYVDEKGRIYRVLTSVWDLSAQQISEIYHHRWMIELFFKWIKQHLSVVHLYSTKPEAVWNQVFLALIAYGLVLLVRSEAKTTLTPWKFLKQLRTYMDKAWSLFLLELNRKPTKPSKGRRKKGKIGRPRKYPEKLKTVKVIVK
jgi:hypothetical protein